MKTKELTQGRRASDSTYPTVQLAQAVAFVAFWKVPLAQKRHAVELVDAEADVD